MRARRWWVYMLLCADGTLYTGATTDIGRRVRQHNGDLSGGARYTSSRRPVVLAYAEEHPGRSEALRAELRLKARSREEKLSIAAAWERRRSLENSDDHT